MRWRLLAELARSDRQVHELTKLLVRPQNLVSYHLGKLRTAGLVSMRRSSADARRAYYSVDLSHFAAQLGETGAALHPGLRVAADPVSLRRPRAGETPAVRVLFLCTGNSARSQIAEAFTRTRSLGRVAAVSAGSHPKPLHPNAIRVMAEHGIDLGRHRSKHVDLYAGQRFDYVISLCDKVREVCPDFDGRPEVIHWSISDPAATSDGDDASYPAFEAVAADLATRVDFLLAAINDSRSRDPRGRRND